MKKYFGFLIIILSCFNASVKSQNDIPGGWDIARCYYDKDSARYILLYHQTIDIPDIHSDENNFLSVWDVGTGKLVRAYRSWSRRWYINDRELEEHQNTTWNDQLNYRYDPPIYNGTYFYIVNNAVKVYYRDFYDSVKFVIHPENAYRRFDFSNKFAMVKATADALPAMEKEKGYTLLMRLDTILPVARSQQLNLNRKKLKTLVDNNDCELFVVTATDSLLALKRNILHNNKFYAYIDSLNQFDEQTMTYRLGFAGNTKDVLLTFNHEWSTAKTPVSVLLFGKPNGEVSAYLNQVYEESVIAARDSLKAITAIRAAVKSKMLPGDKMVADTIAKMEPGNYSNQQIIYSAFDKTVNRTLYVAVKASDDSLYILGRYNSEKLVYMPETSIKKFNTSGYSIYRCSFTGDISYFDVVHQIQSPAYVYYFLTTRPDEKGLAANKKYFDEWAEVIAQEDAETKETSDRYYALSGDMREIQSGINKRCTALRQSAIDNNNILYNGSPSTSTINSSVKDVVDKYDKLSDYVLSNENRIKELAAYRDEYQNYFEEVFASLTEMQHARKKITDIIESANNGEALNLTGIKAAIYDMQVAAGNILAKSDY